jgi:ribulose-phosphate 3-epimerase
MNAVRPNPVLRTSAIRVAPSLLSADFARLGDEVTAIIEAGADLIHFDVMDNHYVPNLTVGPLVCQAINPFCRAGAARVPIDVHLMVKPVDALIPMFAQAGAGIISFHPEASEHIHRTLQLIHSHGVRAGLVLNPATPLNLLDHVLDELDLVLLMSVNPGFGGQNFIEGTLPKIEAVRKRIDETGRDIWLEVDGGVKPGNARRIAQAGADTLVAGSAVFGAAAYAEAIGRIRTEAQAGQALRQCSAVKPRAGDLPAKVDRRAHPHDINS